MKKNIVFSALFFVTITNFAQPPIPSAGKIAIENENVGETDSLVGKKKKGLRYISLNALNKNKSNRKKIAQEKTYKMAKKVTEFVVYGVWRPLIKIKKT